MADRIYQPLPPALSGLPGRRWLNGWFFGLVAVAFVVSLPILVVISLNGGWTADPKKEKPGRDLGYTRFDKMAESLGCYGEFVENPDDIRSALERGQAAVNKGQPALVNVKTDWTARATTTAFSNYST